MVVVGFSGFGPPPVSSAISPYVCSARMVSTTPTNNRVRAIIGLVTLVKRRTLPAPSKNTLWYSRGAHYRRHRVNVIDVVPAALQSHGPAAGHACLAAVACQVRMGRIVADGALVLGNRGPQRREQRLQHRIGIGEQATGGLRAAAQALVERVGGEPMARGQNRQQVCVKRLQRRPARWHRQVEWPDEPRVVVQTLVIGLAQQPGRDRLMGEPALVQRVAGLRSRDQR